jgi:hypothetical protein
MGRAGLSRVGHRKSQSILDFRVEILDWGMTYSRLGWSRGKEFDAFGELVSLGKTFK